MTDASTAAIVTGARNGRDSIDASLRVDDIECLDDHPVIGKWLYCTDVTGLHVVVTIFDDNALAKVDFTEDQWYEFGAGTPDLHRGAVGLTAPQTAAEMADSPTEPREDRDVVRRLGDADRIAAFDIETLATVPEAELDVGTPDHHELLCIGVGAQMDSAREADVLFRRDQSAEAELELAEELCAWLEKRDPDILLTFNGSGFDLPLTAQRARRAAATIDAPARGEAVVDTLGSVYHADLMAAKKRFMGRGSLEDAAAHVGSEPPKTNWTEYDIGLDPGQWRRRQGGGPFGDTADPVVYNSDVPHIGQAWLDAHAAGDEAAEALYECLYDYTIADIEPLFEIATADGVGGQPAIHPDLPDE